MRYYLLVILSILTFPTIMGQSAADQRARIQQEKVAFFNKELNLTKSEEKAFWPLYNDYQNRKNKILSEKRTLRRYYIQNQKHINEDEITDMLDKYIDFEKQETQLLEDFTNKFRAILSDERVLKIYITEIMFKDHLLKALRKN